jgi:hypothetical protein
VAEPIGDDERFEENVAKARAALGQARTRRPRPVAVPDPEPAAQADVAEPALDDREERIAALEADNRRLRAALARIHEQAGDALDR